MKLGAVCGIGRVAEPPHEKDEGTRGGRIARTTWQDPSRLNEANSLSPFHIPSLPLSLFLPSAPFIPSFSPSAASVPTLSLKVVFSPCRAHWARPRTDRNRFWKDEEGRTERKMRYKITGPAGLPSDLLSVSGGHPPSRDRGRSRLVSIPFLPRHPSPPVVVIEEDAPKRVTMCHAQRFPVALQSRDQNRPKIGIVDVTISEERGGRCRVISQREERGFSCKTRKLGS